MLLPAAVEGHVARSVTARVIDAFVDILDMHALGFDRAVPAETGRPGYNPRDMLRLHVYGYLNGVRSSRRLERACCVNVELMRMNQRAAADPSLRDLRRNTVEHPFGTLKRILGSRFLLRRQIKTATETALAVLADKLIRARTIIGRVGLIERLA